MRLIAARGTGGLAQLRAEVDRSLRTRRFLDYGESAGWAGAAQPILAELAAWMVRFGFDDQDFFEIDPVRYASALGEAGPPAYRDAVGASTLPSGISPGGGTALSIDHLPLLPRGLDPVGSVGGVCVSVSRVAPVRAACADRAIRAEGGDGSGPATVRCANARRCESSERVPRSLKGGFPNGARTVGFADIVGRA